MGTSIPSQASRLRKSTPHIRDGDLFNCSPEWASLCYCGVCTLCDHPPGFSRVRCGGCGGMGHKAKTAGSTQSVLIIMSTNVCCALDGRVVVHVTCRDAQVVWSRVQWPVQCICLCVAFLRTCRLHSIIMVVATTWEDWKPHSVQKVSFQSALIIIIIKSWLVSLV